MGKLVILTKCLKTGEKRVFETLDHAASALDVSSSSLSLACVESRETRGYLVRRVERVYLVHLRAYNLWMLCVRNSHGSFVGYGNPARRLAAREYDEVRDITVGWYFQEGE